MSHWLLYFFLSGLVASPDAFISRDISRIAYREDPKVVELGVNSLKRLYFNTPSLIEQLETNTDLQLALRDLFLLEHSVPETAMLLAAEMIADLKLLSPMEDVFVQLMGANKWSLVQRAFRQHVVKYNQPIPILLQQELIRLDRVLESRELTIQLHHPLLAEFLLQRALAEARVDWLYGIPLVAAMDEVAKDFSAQLQIPPAPTTLSSTLEYSGESPRIRIVWSDSGLYEQGYQLFRARDGRPYELLKELGIDEVSYLDSAVEVGKAYRYRIIARGTKRHSEGVETVEILVVTRPDDYVEEADPVIEPPRWPARKTFRELIPGLIVLSVEGEAHPPTFESLIQVMREGEILNSRALLDRLANILTKSVFDSQPPTTSLILQLLVEADRRATSALSDYSLPQSQRAQTSSAMRNQLATIRRSFEDPEPVSP
jgi:hypothetical protein